MLTKAREAANGEKFDRLWRGQTSGYESHSEADMALCCLLAFWTGGNHPQMDRLFRDSGLYREKWDEVHYADGSTYGEKTLERAIQQTSEFYDPDTQPREDHETTMEQSVGTQPTQNTAYLAEKNQVLTERVETLEATLAEKQAYIEELEATVDRLEQRVEAAAPRDQDEDRDTKSASVWERTRSWLK